eukprot:scaffold27985_cov46-Phaeocystis_antarctica.AAC.2
MARSGVLGARSARGSVAPEEEEEERGGGGGRRGRTATRVSFGPPAAPPAGLAASIAARAAGAISTAISRATLPPSAMAPSFSLNAA